jgi:hypothetical protein
MEQNVSGPQAAVPQPQKELHSQTCSTECQAEYLAVTQLPETAQAEPWAKGQGSHS